MDEEAGETPPKPKVPMVKVYNAHRTRDFAVRGGRKIAAGKTGRIPLAVYRKIHMNMPWIKRVD